MPVFLRSVPSIRWRGSRHARSARRASALVALALALGLGAASLAGLGGCASGSNAGPTSSSGGQRSGDGRDIVTASDKSDLDRRADARMDLAREYYKNGQFTTALDEVKQALVARPERADAYMLRGLIYGALGDPATADDSFHRSLQLHPNDADTLHNYGWFLCQVRRFGDADAQFSAAMQVPNYGGLSRTALAQGVCQARAGDLASAEKTLSHAYELDPANPFTAYNLADVLYRRGQYERARFYIRRVNSKDELISGQTLWLAVRIEKKFGNEDGVKEMGRQLRERFPNAPETQLFDKGRFDD